jgi:enoyl-CoA hydratase
MSQPVQVEDTQHGSLVTGLTLDLPERGNALSPAVVSALKEALEAAARRRARVVALRSSGRVFCSGFDLREPVEDDADAIAQFTAIHALLERVRSAPFLTVACVEGAAYGTGADLVAACDYRLVGPRARLRFPGTRFGVVLGLGRLADLVGTPAALDLHVRAAVVDAAQAVSLGLASYLLDEGDMATFVEELADDIAALDDDTFAVLLASRSARASGDAELLLRTLSRPGIAARISAYRELVMQPKRPRERAG